jgi:hypothetical protein
MELKYAPFELMDPTIWHFTWYDIVPNERPMKFSNKSKRIKTSKPRKEKEVDAKSFQQKQREEARKWK